MPVTIPAIVSHRISAEAEKLLDVVETFVEEKCIPADAVLEAQTGEVDARWESRPRVVEDLKARARHLGLWNMFLPRGHYAESPGWTTLEYALMAEWLGRSRVAAEACNCAAPDTGNMEVLAKDGDCYVLNGQKWWSSGAGDPRCAVYIVMGKTNPENKDPYRQQSVVLVPADAPGIRINRILRVYGYDDAPHGHGHLTLTDVRMPVTNIVLSDGRGFEIIQGRLGPGRIHQAMRCIGADTPLAAMWANIRTLRLADGPDEVHLQQMGRNESRRGMEAAAKIKRQQARTEELMKRYGAQKAEPGTRIRHSRL